MASTDDGDGDGEVFARRPVGVRILIKANANPDAIFMASHQS